MHATMSLGQGRTACERLGHAWHVNMNTEHRTAAFFMHGMHACTRTAVHRCGQSGGARALLDQKRQTCKTAMLVDQKRQTCGRPAKLAIEALHICVLQAWRMPNQLGFISRPQTNARWHSNSKCSWF
jgi:hypothetical protein